MRSFSCCLRTTLFLVPSFFTGSNWRCCWLCPGSYQCFPLHLLVKEECPPGALQTSGTAACSSVHSTAVHSMAWCKSVCRGSTGACRWSVVICPVPALSANGHLPTLPRTSGWLLALWRGTGNIPSFLLNAHEPLPWSLGQPCPLS